MKPQPQAPEKKTSEKLLENMILANDPSSNFTESGAERLLVHEVEASAAR